jgi:hypothetical protein
MSEAQFDHNKVELECKEFLAEHNIFVKSVYIQIDPDHNDIMWLYIDTQQRTINSNLIDLIRTKYTYNQIQITARYDGDYDAQLILGIKFNVPSGYE